MFKIGDLVTRNSYKNDIIFEITEIKDNIYYLRGVYIRLCADSYVFDLKRYSLNKNEDNFSPVLDEYKNFNRNEFFYLPGKILHFDSDKEFLKKCMEFYKKNKLKAYGFYMEENKLSDNVISFLYKYKPDILVLTGHDALYRKKRSGNNYKNTNYFISAIKEARKYEKSQDKLFIVAGACQSNYEELIKAGANFASSPKGVNIHALDPAIVAGCISFSSKNEPINLLNILNKTKYGFDGMGGIITNGSMYIGYPR